MTVDVVSDIICPWCYIGKRRLEGAGKLLDRDIDIRWHPFQLNPGMVPEGISRRVYRTAKFGSWEYSQQLDARVAENGRQVGIKFRHDLMQRTPNTFRGHMLLAVGQNLVAERLFAGYFTRGEDVGDPAVLRAIAGECGVEVDLEDPALAEQTRSDEREARESGVQGVPLIRFGGALVSEGAAPEELLAARLRELTIA